MARILLTSLALLGLISVLPAQVYASSPPGLLTTEGVGYARFGFGSYADGRYVLMDGSWRGSLLAIQGLAFRPDHRNHIPTQSMGRVWTRVTLDIYDGDHDGHGSKATSRSFQGIALSTPNRVFQGGVSWIARSGTPPTRPAAFSYRFPFSQYWVYSGKHDLCADFAFAGGVLQNKAPWTPSQAYPYYFDAPGGNAGFVTGSIQTYGQSGTGKGCVDGAGGFGSGAYTRSLLTSYSGQFTYKPYRNSTRISVVSYFTAPGKPVLLAIATKIHPGISFPGLTCNQMHFDPGGVWGMHPAGVASTQGIKSTFLFSGAYQARYVGLQMLTQAGWADGKTGAFMLSAASAGRLPAAPAASFRRRACYAPRSTDATGTLSNDPHWMPLIELRR